MHVLLVLSGCNPRNVTALFEVHGAGCEIGDGSFSGAPTRARRAERDISHCSFESKPCIWKDRITASSICIILTAHRVLESAA